MPREYASLTLSDAQRMTNFPPGFQPPGGLSLAAALT